MRRAWALIIVLTLIVLGVVYFYPNAPEVRYDTAQVTRKDLAIKVTATGLAQPRSKVDIKPPVPGRLEKVLVLEGARVHKGQILAWMSSTERAAVMDAARAKGPQELRHWEDTYKPTPILSPIAGTLIKQSIQEGQSVLGNDVIFTLSDVLIIMGKVDETDIALVSLGQVAQVELDAYPNEPLEGRVSRIDFDATTQNNVTTYGVEVTLSRIPAHLRSGMTANIRFDVETRLQVLSLPTRFIRYQSGEPYALVPGKTPREAPTRTSLTLGLSDGETTEILAPFKEGDVVVLPITSETVSTQGKNPFAPSFRRR